MQVKAYHRTDNAEPDLTAITETLTTPLTGLPCLEEAEVAESVAVLEAPQPIDRVAGRSQQRTHRKVRARKAASAQGGRSHCTTPPCARPRTFRIVLALLATRGGVDMLHESHPT